MGTQPEHLPGESTPGHSDPQGAKVSRQGTRCRSLTFGLFLLFLAGISSIAGFQFARHAAGRGMGLGSAWAKWRSAAPVEAASVASSPETRSDTSSSAVEALARLAPQQQAERALELAIRRQQGSLEIIRQKVDGWRGHLEDTDRLFKLVLEGLNSDDLDVRSAAAEIDLAANNLSKSPQSIKRLVKQIQNDPAERPWALRRLGTLGNRGVEPKTVLAHLLTYAHNRNEQTRSWALEGLAMLGSDDAIDPLLDRFAHDPSPKVRQRAACSLAQSGMLTKEQRLAAVPHLLNLLDDDSLDSATRGWMYGTLRLITGASLGNDAGAWRKWWAHHDSEQEQPSHWTGLLRA